GRGTSVRQGQAQPRLRSEDERGPDLEALRVVREGLHERPGAAGEQAGAVPSELVRRRPEVGALLARSQGEDHRVELDAEREAIVERFVWSPRGVRRAGSMIQKTSGTISDVQSATTTAAITSRTTPVFAIRGIDTYPEPKTIAFG